MARQIMLRDDLYERLCELKRGRSFSQVIQELLEKSGAKPDPILRALEAQNQLLSEMLSEIRNLNKRLSNLRLEIREAKVREVKAEAVTGVTPDRKLPSYLQDNPWVEILSERR